MSCTVSLTCITLLYESYRTVIGQIQYSYLLDWEANNTLACHAVRIS